LYYIILSFKFIFTLKMFYLEELNVLVKKIDKFKFRVIIIMKFETM